MWTFGHGHLAVGADHISPVRRFSSHTSGPAPAKHVGGCLGVVDQTARWRSPRVPSHFGAKLEVRWNSEMRADVAPTWPQASPLTVPAPTGPIGQEQSWQ